ncbi:MAG: murein biosynthesis integral membrane protein MurJ [Aquincola tertiaricarbonis]|uniref:murein biosynthesis integral membrane protein MurJ n=1 Tax=Aquincola tertiaricarbonis TaxID=391953 RepID=UPI000614AB81|nr:murein biosynthesis integral membrane protein MurJ [Aquincola tertiaricarbonis]
MNLFKAASTVSLLTLASRITGLVRDQLMASAFGASAWTDAFNVAFRIPNLLRRLFAEGAFSQAFVPILAATRERDGDAATHQLIDAVATMLFWVLVLTVVVGMVTAPLLVLAIGSGLARFDDAVDLTRWMFPYIGFMSLVALAGGILNTWRRFTVPALTPVLLNVAWIVAALWLAPAFERWGIEPIYAIAVGVLAGGAMQLAVQVPALARIGALPRIGLLPGAVKAAWHHPGVGRVLKQMAPALVGVSVAQLSLLINTQIASRVGVGAVSWLFYADRLMEFPTGLLGVALGVVLLPQLSAAQARGDTQRYSGLLDWGLRLMLVLALPCAVALLVFPKALVSVLFHYGQFNPNDVEQTVRALMGYGVGLMGLVAVKVLAPGFYARQDIRTPVRIAVVVLVVTQLLNLLFVPWFGHAGLALSIGLGALVNAAWLLFGLLKLQVYLPRPGWGLFALRIGAATLALGAALWVAAERIDWIGLQQQPGVRAAWMAAVLAGVAALYFGVLALLGMRPRHFARHG